MDIADLLSSDGIVLRGAVSSKRQALHTVAEAAASALGLDEDRALEALLEREALGSTGLGSGVAVPHARIKGLDRVCAVFVRLESPVAYESLDDRPVDLILFHAVMEWLADPKAALDYLMQQVRPGGVVSVMFYNYNGLLFKNLICGNLTHIEQGMPHRKRFKLQPQQALAPEAVYQWLTDAGWTILGKTGVRTFHDSMQTHMVGDYSLEQVIEMEQKLCRQEPYLSLGRYIHVYAQKPMSDGTSPEQEAYQSNSNKDNG